MMVMRSSVRHRRRHDLAGQVMKAGMALVACLRLRLLEGLRADWNAVGVARLHVDGEAVVIRRAAGQVPLVHVASWVVVQVAVVDFRAVVGRWDGRMAEGLHRCCGVQRVVVGVTGCCCCCCCVLDWEGGNVVVLVGAQAW